MVDVKDMVATGKMQSLAQENVPGTRDLYYLESQSSMHYFCANHEKYIRPASLILRNGHPAFVCEECLWDEDEANLEEAKPVRVVIEPDTPMCANPACMKPSVARCIMCKSECCDLHMAYSTICTECTEGTDDGWTIGGN